MLSIGPLAHRSSKILNESLTRVQFTSPTSSLILRTPESRMPARYFLLSLSSSSINLRLSATFSLLAIPPTNLARGNRVTAHFYKASKT